MIDDSSNRNIQLLYKLKIRDRFNRDVSWLRVALHRSVCILDRVHAILKIKLIYAHNLLEVYVLFS